MIHITFDDVFCFFQIRSQGSVRRWLGATAPENCSAKCKSIQKDWLGKGAVLLIVFCLFFLGVTDDPIISFSFSNQYVASWILLKGRISKRLNWLRFSLYRFCNVFLFKVWHHPGEAQSVVMEETVVEYQDHWLKTGLMKLCYIFE